MEIEHIFKNFVKVCVEKYGIGGKDLYGRPFPAGADQNCVNPYLKTEDDLKVKFGGFLEMELIKNYPNFTVHSELHLYTNPKFVKAKADLSIHKVSNQKLWLMHTDILNSLDSVIEIKYEHYKDPDYSLRKGNIKSDPDKLASLSEKKKKYMIIFDEANKITKSSARKILELANSRGVKILSNNEYFC